MHHPDFSWLCPLKKYQNEFELKKIITYSHQVGLVGCCFCFHARTIGILWHLYNCLTAVSRNWGQQVHLICMRVCGSCMEKSAWMPKHALELYWWLLFKAGSEGLKEQTRQLCAWKWEDGELVKLLEMFQTPHLCPESIATCICPIYPPRQMPSEQLWVDS